MVLDQTLEPTPLDAQTWLSAGLSYINMCEKGFELINMSNTILSTISTNLTELILNSLAISVVIRGSDTPKFVGLNNSNKHKQLSNLAVENPDVVVALDGSGNFTSIQEAVDSAGSRRRGKKYVIYVKAGIYQEYVEIQHKVRNIKMFGDGINKTIITGNRHAGGDTLATPKAGDLKESATFKVYGRGFIAKDITFQNTAGPDGGQALALLSGSDQSAFYRCSFEGYQDTLLTQDSKQFYKECRIYGTVDFIFGDARAVFQDCEIFLRKPQPGGGLVVTAHGRKYHNQTGGYSFQGCNITAADDLKPVIRQYKKAFLGRPWFAYAQTVFIQSFLDDLVDPKGWLDSWGYNKTAYCGEYENNGKGASTHKRVQWPNYQVITDPKIAEHFTVVHLISGNRWLPATSVPYISGLEKL
ncbi:putative pectinesterase [Tanacetum coccineum]|uniref:Pectinesterase n=1 Tax=Tanacetum coccineum TaxID=301880 RepID=A0ABQ4XCH6_9ASTR